MELQVGSRVIFVGFKKTKIQKRGKITSLKGEYNGEVLITWDDGSITSEDNLLIRHTNRCKIGEFILG